MWGHSLIFCALLATLSGCDRADEQADMRSRADQIARTNALEARIERLERQASPRSAILKLGDDGYSTVETEYGAMAFNLVKIAPKGSGSAVTFKIGNPYAADFPEAEIGASWGPVTAKREIDPSKKVDGVLKLTAPILGGRWSAHTVTIDGTKPADLGFVSIDYLLFPIIRMPS